MIARQSPEEEEHSSTAVTSSLAVLDRLVEINQTAQINEGFTAIVETISACVTDDLLTSNARHSLTRIKRRLNIGSSLPSVSTGPTPRSALHATFEFSQDLPGSLSIHGARHDNDHARITDIQILPTAEEITSFRQEYLPLLDSRQNHMSGLPGLLDRHFRLLREDTVGQLRDAVCEEVKRLGNQDGDMRAASKDQQGVRKLVYHNVRFSGIRIDRKKGLQIVADFDQPVQLKNKSKAQREDWWKASKFLQFGALVCFVSQGGKIVFFSVSTHGRKDSDLDNEDEVPSLFEHEGRASLLLELAEYTNEHATWICSQIDVQSCSRQSLVEFPGVLLPAFQPTLKALQKMSKTLDLPFADILAPEDLDDSAAVIRPPAYASRRGFRFDLEVLARMPLTLTPGKAFDFDKLAEGSTLDDAQQSAVVDALSRGLALIQGPPGTGKSYTGVAILKALLQNRETANLGPIICVSYTNHALDQLLEDLVENDVKQVIRLGSQSKSAVLEKATLYHVAQEIEPTKTEKHDRWMYNNEITNVIRRLEDVLFGLNRPNSWRNIQTHLLQNHKRHFDQLFGTGLDEDGFQEVKGEESKLTENWIRGAPRDLTSSRRVSQLTTVPLKQMSTSERMALHQHWINERRTELTNKLINLLDSFYSLRSAQDKGYNEVNLRCLREANIIGVTTSGLARNIELLQRVGAKVVLCEEAGEVLEAQTLTAFLPSIEHAILIGDHEQLRPQINNYELQHDNPRGKKYSHDVSLFERLVMPQMGNFHIPFSTLKTQRRMHPSISQLIRVPLYPRLEDHPSVLGYPEVEGMRDRLYWLDHQEEEDPRAAETVSLSRTNTFEVDMVAALVSHLVRQGIYGNGDIAVITPYLGQLQKIKKRLASSFEIVVGDRDQEELEAKGLEDTHEPATMGLARIQKTTLLNAIRIASVDNFQGDEAKVIVVSLVRCNKERKCGFLRTSNRINVLLSRARHGMYIIGN